MLLRLFLLLSVLGSSWIGRVNSHQESGEWSCETDEEIRIEAGFRPGLITLDGHADDWKDIDAFDSSLLPALDPDDDKEYTGGKMTVKALHDGNDVFYLLQVDGSYAYTKGDNHKCPSVALMFPIGDEATYHNMGGCKEGTDTCNKKTCKGHEVDIMHFSVGNAIPGRLYGGNPLDNGDGNGGLVIWLISMVGIHTVDTLMALVLQEMILVARITGKGHGGTVASMSTQDAQFTIGGSSKMAVAFWYPVDGNSWHGSGHYSVNCDWIPLDISPGSSSILKASTRGGSGDVASAFALLFSVLSICLSVFVGYRAPRSRNENYETVPNQQMATMGS
ncbi:HEME BINDING PROTEIN [Salix purpurea]|uniref:HEME BINDING PROTEIN n=1 Tax=Salix purpurea TaxID=77065 RepID=A0A9Q0P1V9_SALPP|nr:HEME BINDING PROTEIN [Salix purpurea]